MDLNHLQTPAAAHFSFFLLADNDGITIQLRFKPNQNHREKILFYFFGTVFRPVTDHRPMLIEVINLFALLL